MKKRWVFVNVVALTALVCVGYASANTTRSADFDGDGLVGISDFLFFVEQFGSSRGDGTAAHLSAIDSLSLSGARLTALKAGIYLV